MARTHHDSRSGKPKTSHAGIVPTFFLSGFECSTFLWKDRRRRDLVAETQHREHAQQDYELLQGLGIAVAREGIPWPMADRGGGQYDFSMTAPVIEAMKRTRITPIWDLCHYGYPDDADPFDGAFPERFGGWVAPYARRCAWRCAARRSRALRRSARCCPRRAWCTSIR